jgi:hypothetical protein
MLVEDGHRFTHRLTVAVTLGSWSLVAGGKPSRDERHEHRKAAQQRIDPAIKRRRGSESSLRGFVPCHGQHYHPGFSTHSLKTGRFFIL